jgi:GNAT superfamily N-acetyltransferase
MAGAALKDSVNSKMIVFQEARLVEHRSDLLDINVEYATWVASELNRGFQISLTAALGMSVPDYMDSVLGEVCGDTPPAGIFYLLKVGGQIAGMCGLRQVRAYTGEVKHFYVRPGYRGLQLGQRMVQRLIEDARAFGYRKLLIDTAPFMTSAHRIYAAAGFVDCLPFSPAETPEPMHTACRGWRVMERDI